MADNRSPEENAFREARARCENPRHKDFPYYGGRGIEMRFSCFSDLYAHVGKRPSPIHTLDRIKNDGHYEPGNVRWATRSEQAQNRRKPTPRPLRSHCYRGHPLSGNNLYTITDLRRGPIRACRACRAINASKRYQAQTQGNPNND